MIPPSPPVLTPEREADIRAYWQGTDSTAGVLLAELDRLRAQVEGHCERIAAAHEVIAKNAEKPTITPCDAAHELNAALMARLIALQRAALPFAKFLSHWSTGWPDSTRIATFTTCKLTLGEIRALAALLPATATEEART